MRAKFVLSRADHIGSLPTPGTHHDAMKQMQHLLHLGMYYDLSGMNLCLNSVLLIFQLRNCYSLLIFHMVNDFSEFFHSASFCKELVDGILDPLRLAGIVSRYLRT